MSDDLLLTAHYSALAHYNLRFNQRLYDRCAELGKAQRRRDLGAFFGSVHGTLNHVLLADRIWLTRFRDHGPPSPALAEAAIDVRFASLAEPLYDDFDELRAQREDTDRAISAWAVELSPEALSSELAYLNTRGDSLRHPLWYAALHLFDHQTHHRGQITTLLTQLGGDVGVTDLLAFLREAP